jgi:hypothetical protein
MSTKLRNGSSRTKTTLGLKYGTDIYVHDIFATWPHGEPDQNTFLDNLNRLKPTIKFSIRKNTTHTLTIVDRSNISRKATHSGQY